MIQLENISKVYTTRAGEVRALDGVSLAVQDGEFVAIKGPSGSGKSTLLLTIAGMVSPTEGRAVVDGVDVYAMSGRECARFRAENIGFVFQMFHLLPYLNILDNVVAAAVAPNAAKVREKAQSLLCQFGLESRLHHRPGQLSAGERQRAAVARAMINNPRLILADEPTGNLDAKNAEAVLDLLAEFHQNGRTVLLATHDESAAARAQGSLQMQAGEILGEDGAAAADASDESLESAN